MSLDDLLREANERRSPVSEKCPNCDIELTTAKFSDLMTEDADSFDVWINYCPECRYVGECWAE